MTVTEERKGHSVPDRKNDWVVQPLTRGEMLVIRGDGESQTAQPIEKGSFE